MFLPEVMTGFWAICGTGMPLAGRDRAYAAMSSSTPWVRPPWWPRSRAAAWPSRDFSRMYSRSDSAMPAKNTRRTVP